MVFLNWSTQAYHPPVVYVDDQKHNYAIVALESLNNRGITTLVLIRPPLNFQQASALSKARNIKPPIEPKPGIPQVYTEITLVTQLPKTWIADNVWTSIVPMRLIHVNSNQVSDVLSLFPGLEIGTHSYGAEFIQSGTVKL